MLKAYIILAHRDQIQVTRLIDSLDDGSSHFFLHIDLKSTLYQQRHNLVANKTKLHLVKSVKTAWGGLSLVMATINAMKAVRKMDIKFERVILISGQDYPIKSNRFINKYLRSSDYSIFLDYSSLPNFDKWQSGGLYRVTKYYLGLSAIQRFFAKVINFLARYIRNLRRGFPDTKHYYGSQWMILDDYTVNYILKFIDNNPDYLSFHKFTFAPDEIFFHTIILNSNDERILNNISNDNKMFMLWKDEESPHPEVLSSDNFKLVENSDALFARKFDRFVDSEVLDLIDSQRKQP